MRVPRAVEERRGRMRRRCRDGGRRRGRGDMLLTAGVASAAVSMQQRRAEVGATVKAVVLHRCSGT